MAVVWPPVELNQRGGRPGEQSGELVVGEIGPATRNRPKPTAFAFAVEGKPASAEVFGDEPSLFGTLTPIVAGGRVGEFDRGRAVIAGAGLNLEDFPVPLADPEQSMRNL